MTPLEDRTFDEAGQSFSDEEPAYELTEEALQMSPGQMGFPSQPGHMRISRIARQNGFPGIAWKDGFSGFSGQNWVP